MILTRYGENGVRIKFGDAINLETHEKVRQCYFFLKEMRLPDIIDITPAFTACLIHFDTRKTSFTKLAEMLSEREFDMASAAVPEPSVHEITVRYGGVHGLDMSFVCAHCGLTEDEVVTIHAAELYTVFTVGFIPGFPYLGVLDQRLNTPRLETPRVRVPKGSVGIAQRQTGIYPFQSPGGWRIIGQTETSLFDAKKEPYSLMQIGDKVRFIQE
jgi:KipI family sensor histidine kinase inhibitor